MSKLILYLSISISNNMEETGGQNETEQTISDCQPMEIDETRKHTRNSHLWKRNVKAAAKNKGEQYVKASGIIVSPKVLKLPCTNCCFDCNSKLNLEKRESIKKEFWAIRDKSRQR